MNRENLKKAFREIKKELKLNFSITRPDDLGDCMSCVNYALCKKYGEDAKGIWLKHWEVGMNKSYPLERQESVFIAHDLTDEQGERVIEILKSFGYEVAEEFSHDRCIEISEKQN